MTLPSFIESPRFPSLLGWEYSVEPLYMVDVIMRGQLFERRNLAAVYPRRRLTITIPPDKEADIILLNRWHHAVRGKLIGFRVLDPTDYLSIDLDNYLGISETAVEACTANDQPLAELTSSPGSFQLIKRYRLDGLVEDLDQELPIVKPVASTIKIANTLGDEQDAATWDLDEETGIVEAGTGFVGTPGFWGGQFDLPMRFETGLPMDVRDMRIAGASFSLLELRSPPPP